MMNVINKYDKITNTENTKIKSRSTEHQLRQIRYNCFYIIFKEYITTTLTQQYEV